MKIWKLNLNHRIFPYVANGRKSVEGRAWSKKRDYRKMKRGDKIIFSDLGSSKKTAAVIEGVKRYKNVKDYLTSEGLKKCLPWVKSLSDGIGVYYGITDDYEERIRKGGIFAIRIRINRIKRQ